jgi:hypothetical protein
MSCRPLSEATTAGENRQLHAAAHRFGEVTRSRSPSDCADGSGEVWTAILSPGAFSGERAGPNCRATEALSVSLIQRLDAKGTVGRGRICDIAIFRAHPKGGRSGRLKVRRRKVIGEQYPSTDRCDRRYDSQSSNWTGPRGHVRGCRLNLSPILKSRRFSEPAVRQPVR